MSTDTIAPSIPELAEPFTLPELTLMDRCDSCRQHAVSVVQISTDLPYLYFCAHHWRTHATKLVEHSIAYHTTLPANLARQFTFNTEEFTDATA